MRFHLGNKPKVNRNIVTTKRIISVVRKTMSDWRCESTTLIGGLYDHFYKQFKLRFRKFLAVFSSPRFNKTD